MEVRTSFPLSLSEKLPVIHLFSEQQHILKAWAWYGIHKGLGKKKCRTRGLLEKQQGYDYNVVMVKPRPDHFYVITASSTSCSLDNRRDAMYEVYLSKPEENGLS